MNDCTAVAPLLPAWVDGSLDPITAQHVTEHVGACASCSEQARRQRAVHQLIAERRSALRSDGAPDALVARLQSLRPEQVASGARRRWFRVPVAVAATLVLALTGATLHVATGRSTTVLAAQLVADHAACRLTGHLEQGLNPEAAKARMANRYGLYTAVPPGTPDGRLQLVGARRCLTGVGRNAHIVYRYGGRLVSLFLLPQGGPRDGILRVLGERAYVWSRHNGTYVLVAAADVDGLPQIAQYMQQATQ